MNIIIVGAGKIGQTICAALSTEGNDVTLIEKKSKILQRVMDTCDITGIVGNGASYDVLLEADVKHADIFIATTPSDEVNIMASIIAKKLGAKYVVARNSNPEYSKHIDFAESSLGISRLISPEHISAKAIARMLQFPSALKIENFVNGRVSLVEIKVNKESLLDGVYLHELTQKVKGILVCIVQRGETVIIPNGFTQLRADDHIFITGEISDLNNCYKINRNMKQKIKSVLIIGGGTLVYYLLELLRHSSLDIKVIEESEERALLIAGDFPNLEVIIGDGTDQAVLKEEGLEHYDAIVAMTGNDEENVILSMFAAKLEVKKIITKVNRTVLLQLLENSGLQSFITPKEIVTNHIIRLIRALENSQGSNVEVLHRLANNQVEALQFQVRPGSKIINIPLYKLPLKANTLISAIIRGNDLIFPRGQDAIYGGDRVIVITKGNKFDDVEEIINNKL